MIHSDSGDDSRTIQSTPSSISRKKRVANVSINRSNKSYTSFFFRIDENNYETVYCKICERVNQSVYPYTRKGGSTSNMITHLRDKHGIIKDNYTEYLDDYKEVLLN
jgi:hypothetical protein